MDKVNEILNNKDYKVYLEELSELEKERVFCNHTIEHFLDVSRIAYIRVLEEGLKYSKEVIYAIGLLHDICLLYTSYIGKKLAEWNLWCNHQ